MMIQIPIKQVQKPVKFFKQQIHCLRQLDNPIVNEVLYGGAAGGGKSWVGSYWLVKNCIRYPGTSWLVGRNKLKRLKETTIKTINRVLRSLGLKPQRDYKYKEDVGYFFYNGSEIVMKDLAYKPSDPDYDDLGSLEITGGFIDEVGQITQKCWETVKSRIRFKLDEFGLTPKLLGSCNPSKGWVYSLFYKPHKEGKLPENKVYIQAKVTDNIYISSTYQQNLSELTDPIQRDRLLNGNWDYADDAMQIIPSDKIIDFVQGVGSIKTSLHDRYITADIARFGSDKSVIMVWQGWTVIYISEFEKNKINDIAKYIKGLMYKYNVSKERVVVDEDGVGGGVVDLIDCLGFVNNSTPLQQLDGEIIFENYQNLKAQCGYAAGKKIANSEALVVCELTLTQEETLIQELAQLQTWDIDFDGKLKIKPKDEIKKDISRSPDYLDNIIMRGIFEYKLVDKRNFNGIFF